MSDVVNQTNQTSEVFETSEVLDGFKETELGPLPVDWEVVRFGNVATLQRGKDLPKRKRVDGPYPIIGSNGIVGYHNEFVSEGPGVTVGRSGSVGKLVYVEGRFWPLNTALWIKDFHDNDEKFVFYLLNLFNFQRYATGVSVPTLNRNYVHEAVLPLPPLPEQRRIAHVLNTIQRQIAAQDALIAAAREVKRSLMQRLFTYGPGPEPAPTKETQFGDVPQHWQIITLDKCAFVQTGTAKGRKFGNQPTVEVPYLRVANVQDGYLDLSEIKNIRIKKSEIDRYRLQDGDVVLTEGGDFDKLGRGFIWRGQIPNCIHQNHIFAVRANREMLSPEYLAYLVQSDYGKAYFLTVAHRTTNLASINTTKLKALPTIIPPPDEQSEIAHILTTADRKIAAEEQRQAALQELFKPMLHQLMTGQIRLRADKTSEVSKTSEV